MECTCHYPTIKSYEPKKCLTCGLTIKDWASKGGFYAIKTMTMREYKAKYHKKVTK